MTLSQTFQRNMSKETFLEFFLRFACLVVGQKSKTFLPNGGLISDLPW